MMRARVRNTTLAICGAMTLAAVASCREPTQIVVEARTNLAFRAGMVASFTVGTPGETENAEPTTQTRAPWGTGGFVGSLAVVPGSSDDAALSVKVVLGVDRDARSCAPPAYEGCIVARRRLRYTPHERLRLPITLYAQCLGVPCTAQSTCNLLGQCVDAQVDPKTCAGDQGCVVPGDPQPAGPAPAGDGGDAGDGAMVIADASSDGGATDASTDSPIDGPSESGTGGGVDCRNGAVRCQVGEICCYETTTGGACILASANCPYQRIECDGREQCLPGQLCCASAGGTRCGQMSCVANGEVCHSTKNLPLCYLTSQTCTGLLYSHYKSCK